MSTKADAHVCAECGWQTEVWVEEAPGPSGPRCKVCDLQAEVDLVNVSRRRISVQRDAFQARIDAVRAIHSNDLRHTDADYAFCCSCGERQPCPTRRALAEVDHDQP